MLPLRQLTPAPRRNHEVRIAAVQVERRQASEEARPSKCPAPGSCYPNFFLIQEIFGYSSSGQCCCCHSYLPYLVSFSFYFFFIYLLFIPFIYSTEQVLNKSGSPLPLLSAHDQPPPPSCHLDPTSPGFISTNQMPSKRMNQKMKVMKGEKMRRLKMKMRMKMRKKAKSTKSTKMMKTTTTRQHQHQH